MITGGIVEIGSLGTLTFGVAIAEVTGVGLITDGWMRATAESRNLQLPKWDSSYDTQILKNSKPDTTKAPPYQGDKLGINPQKPKAKGFEWKGKGPPGSSQGSWYNPATGESLHPDLDHPPPLKPHWDYVGPDFPQGARLYPDGTWEPK